MIAEAEPINLKEALANRHWKLSMEEELRVILNNKTWEPLSLLEMKNHIDVRWVFETKIKPSGEVLKYKARLVAMGFLGKFGLDFNEIFTRVARMEKIRLVVGLASQRRWKMS